MQEIGGVLDSGKYILGEHGAKFETNFASYIGMPLGIAVNSGTDAIKIALRALNIGAGDEIITVSNTAVPTVSALREVGAIPVFVDIDQYNTIDVTKIEKAITPKTKAIIPVHLYGQACDIEAVMKIAKKHNLKVIEDCAQSVGATINNRMTGSFGDVSAWSFYPTKNLGAYGDGGMILMRDEAVRDRAKRLRMYGMEKTYSAEEEGWNSRMDEVQAAILNIKLELLPVWTARRQEIAARYLGEITNPKITLPQIRPQATNVFHLFVIKTAQRAALQEYLKSKAIGFGVHYPFPIHLQKAYAFLGGKKGDLPISEKNAEEVLSLPIFPELTDAEVSEIISAFNAF